jgi:hypothetical protein
MLFQFPVPASGRTRLLKLAVNDGCGHVAAAG